MRTWNNAIASLLLCGAVGFVYPAMAQVGGAAGGTNSAGAASNAGVTAGGSPTPAGNASGDSASASAPSFLGSVQSKSTPAKGLNKAAMARVDSTERQTTAELNRASAASTGNANAANQASVNARGATITQ